ncbi:MAG: glycerophosphodiester phosphodiesterase [Phyllobacteriaceae bacterium]|nr:glycerophosphodiester phosphodiesterase [Phyllobacteriaceae bacterium]
MTAKIRDNPGATRWISERPIAHRGLHDVSRGIFENTLSAAKAAIEHGYAIEVDLHPSRDGVPMVFHDNTLNRLTQESGNVRDRSAGELASIGIGGSADRVPTLAQLLDLTGGRSGLVLELKGIAGEDDGFVAAVLSVLEDYDGPVAIMSFNHWLLADARKLGATIPVGLTAEGDDKLNGVHREAMAAYQPDFVSYGIDDLPNDFVREFHETGRPVITWTVRSPEAAAKSALYADQITFEGFLPPLPEAEQAVD